MKARFGSALAALGLFCDLSFAALADANPDVWAYKDWSVTRAVAADKTARCRMTAQQGSVPLILTVSHASSDAGPPDGFPTITLVTAVNDGPMAVEETVMADWRFDGGPAVAATLSADYVGEQNVFKVDPALSRQLLAAMARGNHVDVDDDVFGTTTYALAGFAAVYRKMADWCSFPVEGVL